MHMKKNLIIVDIIGIRNYGEVSTMERCMLQENDGCRVFLKKVSAI